MSKNIDKVLKIAGNKNQLAKELGETRQRIQYCVNQGYFTDKLIKKVSKKYNIPVQDLVMDRFL